MQLPHTSPNSVINDDIFSLAMHTLRWLSPAEENHTLKPIRGYWDAINGNPSWHLVDSPMESGAPGHNRSLDAPEAIPMAAVKQVLREAGEKSELQYQQAFSDMASKLHLTLETAHQTFEQDNGGWDTFVELHGNNVAVKSWKGQEHFNLCFLMGMIVAGVVLLGWLFSRR
uniref:Uncharacterized protein n=1 Tax=Marmota marmota marmota TaxID=9994 RepID=A0A8C6EYW0_MARMA